MRAAAIATAVGMAVATLARRARSRPTPTTATTTAALHLVTLRGPGTAGHHGPADARRGRRSGCSPSRPACSTTSARAADLPVDDRSQRVRRRADRGAARRPRRRRRGWPRRGERRPPARRRRQTLRADVADRPSRPGAAIGRRRHGDRIRRHRDRRGEPRLLPGGIARPGAATVHRQLHGRAGRPGLGADRLLRQDRRRAVLRRRVRRRCAAIDLGPFPTRHPRARHRVGVDRCRHHRRRRALRQPPARPVLRRGAAGPDRRLQGLLVGSRPGRRRLRDRRPGRGHRSSHEPTASTCSTCPSAGRPARSTPSSARCWARPRPASSSPPRRATAAPTPTPRTPRPG